MAAAARHNHAPNFFPAAPAGFACTLIHAMPLLKFAALPFRVHIIRNGGASQYDGGGKDFPHGTVQREQLLLAQFFSNLGGMNPRAVQAFIRVDISNSPQHTLVQQQCLDSRTARSQFPAKVFRSDLQRFSAQRPQKLRHAGFRNQQHAAKAADIPIP